MEIKSEKDTYSCPEAYTDKCSVCLQAFSISQSFTSTCNHSFCFECLLEWSRIKYNCPLCKRAFDRILFFLTGDLEFKEFQLEAKDEANRPMYQALEIIEQPTTSRRVEVSRASWLVGKEAAPLVFRMLVYIKEWYAYPKQSQSFADLDRLNKEFNDTESLRSLIQSPKPQTYIIYKRVRNHRDITSQWYTQNPACTHRLMNFIHRELKAISCVLKKNDSKLPVLNIQMRSNLMGIIIQKLKIVEFGSNEFPETIKEFIMPVQLAKHFIHELESYAKSTSTTLTVYDSRCVYYLGSSLQVSRIVDPITLIPKTLPVNLSKYRLHYKPDLTTVFYSSSEDDKDEEEATQSDRSSFCEEIELPEAQSPQYIVIDSSRSGSSDNDNDKQSRSTSRTNNSLDKRINKHLKKVQKDRSRSKKRSNI